jgi:exosortase H (IPTLxxWG-CTERM-specific)
MFRFFAIFILLLIVLFTVEILQPVQQAVIIPWTGLLAKISAWLMQLFDSDIRSGGVIIQSIRTGFGVEIVAGCNGVEATLILLAAILAFPASARHKLIGFAIGFLAIQGLNLVRIISLFYIGQWDREVFDWAHLYIWQALIMLDAMIVWLVWIRMLPRKTAHAF